MNLVTVYRKVVLIFKRFHFVFRIEFCTYHREAVVHFVPTIFHVSLDGTNWLTKQDNQN